MSSPTPPPDFSLDLLCSWLNHELGLSWGVVSGAALLSWYAGKTEEQRRRLDVSLAYWEMRLAQ